MTLQRLDLGQLRGVRPITVATGVLAGMTIADLMQLCGCGSDARLRRFLDLQLKLYSQEPADRTAALYGATVLQMAQAPLGLWHLHGSMQVLSDRLVQAIVRDGGDLKLRQRVVGMTQKGRTCK